MRAIISPHKQPLPFLCAPRLEYSLKVQVCSKSPHQHAGCCTSLSMQHRFVSHTSKFHVADLSVQRSSNLNQLLDSTVLRLHGFLPVVLFTWNNKVLLRSWSICIYLNMLVAPVTMQKELPPIEIIKREGMHSTGQGKAMNISIPAPTPTLHPPCLSSTSNVLPSAGRRAHYIA